MALGSLPKKIVDKDGNITADAQNWFNLLWQRTGGAISNVAPYDATYILKTPDTSALPDSQALSLLNSGFVKVSTGTGVLSSTGHDLIQAADLVNAGAFSGDISGTFPTATVIKINGASLGFTTATAGNVLIGSGSQWVTNAISGDATLGSTGTLTLADTSVTAGSYTINGSAAYTVDGKGRLTSASSVTVTDATLSTSDITTNNVSTTKHGFAPKAPNDATKYLDGTGNYSVPTGSGSGTVNSGTTGQVAYYASSSTAVSGGTLQNVKGVTSGSNSSAGNVGELLSSQVVFGSAISITAGTQTNITSKSLTAGNWLVFGNIIFANSGEGLSLVQAGFSTTSATQPDASLNFILGSAIGMQYAGGCVPFQILNLTTTTTVYLVGVANFTGTTTAAGYLGALRIS